MLLFLPNFSLGVLNPHVLVCEFLLYDFSKSHSKRNLPDQTCSSDSKFSTAKVHLDRPIKRNV